MPDAGTKTLAQLEEEGKEKKYITLETGAKISGYTKEYLERLCRLNQVDYRVWNNGQLVIELESLLNATKAILLSYDGITFVDRNELMDPTPQIVGKILADTFADVSGSRPAITPTDTNAFIQPIPTFLNANRIPPVAEHPREQVTVVGRSVNANRELFHDEHEIHIPVIDAGAKDTPTSVLPSVRESHEEHHGTSKSKIVQPPLPPSPYRPITTSVDASVHHDPAPLFPPVGKKQDAGTVVVLRTKEDTEDAPRSQQPPSPVHLLITKDEHPPLVRPASVGVPSQEIYVVDDWDQLLFSGDHVHNTANEVSTVKHAVAPDVPPLNLGNSSTAPQHNHNESSSNAVSIATHDTSLAVQQDVSATAFHPRVPRSSTKRYPAIPIQMPIPRAPMRIVRGTEDAPLLRVMPDANTTSTNGLLSKSHTLSIPAFAQRHLPMISPEQHPALVEPHPLLTNTGFNAAFLFLAGGILALSLGGVAIDRIRSLVTDRPEEYVAAAALPGLTFSKDTMEQTPQETAMDPSLLPFSDPVIAVEGDDGTTILVQPIFPSGAGEVYEYRPKEVTSNAQE